MCTLNGGGHNPLFSLSGSESNLYSIPNARIDQPGRGVCNPPCGLWEHVLRSHGNIPNAHTERPRGGCGEPCGDGALG